MIERGKENATHCVIDAGVSAGHYDSHELCLERERGNQDMMLRVIRWNEYTSVSDMRKRILATLNSPKCKSVSNVSDKID